MTKLLVVSRIMTSKVGYLRLLRVTWSRYMVMTFLSIRCLYMQMTKCTGRLTSLLSIYSRMNIWTNLTYWTHHLCWSVYQDRFDFPVHSFQSSCEVRNTCQKRWQCYIFPYRRLTPMLRGVVPSDARMRFFSGPSVVLGHRSQKWKDFYRNCLNCHYFAFLAFPSKERTRYQESRFRHQWRIITNNRMQKGQK